MSEHGGVDALAAKARACGAPVAVVELQWGDSSYDKAIGGWRASFALCAILERPGPRHARYSVERLTTLPADEPAEHRAAVALATALAQRLGVEVSTLAIERERTVGSRWIERQPVPTAAYAMAWEASWWDDDGRRHDERGETTVDATSGSRAEGEVERALAARFDDKQRPVWLRVWPADAMPGGSTHYHRYSLAACPPREVVRGWHRGGQSLAAIAAALRSGTPAPTPLQLLLVVHDAFGLDLDALAPVADWAAGSIDDAGLDAALDSLVLRRQTEWDRPHRLRQARTRGHSVGAQLREERATTNNSMPLFRDVREAFDLEFGAAKVLLDAACEGRDARVDEILTEAGR